MKPELILGVSGARGIVGESLDEGVVTRLARAFCAQLSSPGPVLVGRDTRPSGARLAEACMRELRSAGREAVDLGVVPTPTVQLAVEVERAAGGIVITASHNPPAWNGLKFISPAGIFLDAAAMDRLIARFHESAPSAEPSHADEGERPSPSRGMDDSGTVTTKAGMRAVRALIERILPLCEADRIRAQRPRVVIDAVHGAGAVVIAPLLEQLGVEADWIDGEPDGRLPEHPEPRAERLEPLARAAASAGAQIGFALDPDGDRLALVLPDRVLGEEWTLPLCAARLLARGLQGPLVTNLSTSARIEWIAARHGQSVARTPVGEAHVVSRMKSLGATLGGEGNGGVIDARVHYGRDAAVGIAQLLSLEISGPRGRDGIAFAVNEFPPFVLVKDEAPLSRAELVALEPRLVRLFGEPGDRSDGLRWSWPGRWLHVRPSNTEPKTRIFAEAADDDAAREMVRAVKEQGRQSSR
ncbi:MAG: phosphoglucosamine mutase [Candidatus Eisenbacteria bacterium]|nr:phosphoglucosamine mutase [Candidatus Eisenbacteria bacterium]